MFGFVFQTDAIFHFVFLCISESVFLNDESIVFMCQNFFSVKLNLTSNEASSGFDQDSNTDLIVKALEGNNSLM